jgi:hypothetical protein
MKNRTKRTNKTQATIRDLFHDIGNCHNRICIIAEVTREMLTKEDITALKLSEIKEITSKVVKALKEIEQNACGADKITADVKKIIYKIVDPDALL